ncbi:aliphatic sulfonate ABC transporter substrate-binding protein [Aminobacter carboxidus]|uniref:Aliphatic sulfonate ABC transporter substrate-binding protein n=1 Tax=Aminobacter carboxidus TaxID=376165 RepID=A0A8E1WFZ9_9HYPH|nr:MULTISPECIES: aliphatic sulfonate ABC transporter substrate-binding protein [Aminobacter carboxidus group]MBB6466790.1 NitT/TauT family transport system substrate-binding protein [Aminobacter lissarensis]MBE1203164.1 aliphatic sulfonate ABC transporter substrate-binding protein [Aminobacter carboxidus]
MKINLTRRGFLAASASALAAPTVLSFGSAARAEAKAVRVGYIADYFGTSLTAIASDQDLWAKHGLEAELKVFTNGPIQVQALGAGSLDFGYVGPGALWLPASGKAKIVAMNALGLSDRVIAQAGFNSMADLKGKKIGVPEGTSGDMLLRLALAKAGMQLTDVEVVKMDPSTVVSAFASKQIDGAGIWYPLVGVIKKTVPDLVEVAQSADFFPANSFPSAFVTRNEVAAQDPDTVKKMIAVLKDANDFRAADVPRSVEITAKFLGVPAEPLITESNNGKYLTSAELIAATKDGSVAGWLKGLNQQFVAFGKLKDPLDPKDYYLGDLYAG